MLKVKKIFSAFVGMAMAANALITMPFSAFADEETSRTYIYDDYEVSYDVTNSWGNTEIVSVTLSNTGDSAIENWMLYFDPNGQVHDTVNVQEMQTTAGITYFKNSGYNATVNPDSSVSFSYMVDNCEAIPDDFTLCQTRAVKESGYQVSLQVNQTWGDSFNGEIIIQNNTDQPIEAWELTVDTNFTITEITNSWAATVIELEPYSYMLKGTYTGTVYANSSVSLGFNGVKSGDPVITDYSLTEVVVSEDIINDAVNTGLLYDDCIDWSELPDSDGDGLPDEYEAEYGCDQLNPDSDGDGLPDGYEILTLGSDPANAHSLDTVLSDGEYDNDQDGLSNYEEYLLGTDPLVADSDYDGLSDGDEENIYGTDPLNPDTDGDSLFDGDEIALGLNPLVADSNDDGIPDNEEMFPQNKSFDAGDTDTVVQNIDIAFEGTGYIDSTTTVESIMNDDWMCSNIVGLIGEPYDISSSSKIKNAEITFKINKSSLGNTQFSDLRILWYNEEEQRFIEMETIPNAEKATLTAKSEHFSKYLIVDCKQWYNAWKNNLYPITGSSLHTAITIDCSGSMDYNDPEYYRVIAANGYVDVMSVADLASVILFSDGASEEQGLTNEKMDLKDAIKKVETYGHGTTNYESALRYSINSLENQDNSNYEKAIIFLSDGHPTNIVDGVGVEIPEDEFDYSLVDEAAANGIRIYTIGLTNNVNENILKEMARRTNGEYYYANTAEALIAYFLTINMGEKYDITTDTDNDGIPDLFETYGMPIANGQVLFSNPNVPDSDGDGLKDGEEVIMHIVNNDEEATSASAYLEKFMYDYIPTEYISSNGGIYFELVTDPTNDDTDGDGIIDGNEVENVTTDSRYNNLNPLVKDTLESLFVEYHQDTMINQRNNAVYIQIDQNTVTINARIKYTNAYNEPASSYITWNDEESQDIYNSLGEDCTLKDLFEDGVKRRWGGLYSGTKYDFYPGLSINVNVRFINYNENTMTDCRYIIANLTNTMGGVSSTSGGYDTTENKTITMKSLGDLASIYEGICAHEFGHTLLLADAYPSANHGYTPIISTDNNRELYCTVTNAAYGRPGGGEIMYYNSDALPNDIEMLLIGYSYNEKQYFTPWNNREVSHAIKESNIYLNTEDKKYYIWENGAFVEYTEGDIA
ncbi:MAG: cellulose binding domain-containing protein [Oscillospiraceae bacterium]|nr:cellulose binding domain-containing protein [Oscillospiraceae bacterium]